MKKVLFLSFLIACLFMRGAEGIILSSLSPADKTTTFAPVLTLAGIAPGGIAKVNVNGHFINTNNTSFKCGLVLDPGKNHVEATVRGEDGTEKRYGLRILRLVSFPDVEMLYDKRPHWAKQTIIALATLGIIEGYPDNNFYVNKSLTRGELATWVCRAEDLKYSAPTKDVFRDAPKEHWRAPFIKAVTDKGFMSADAAGNFGIDQPITRADAALVALNAEGASFERELLSVFFDVPKTHPYYKEIKLAKSTGLVKGISWKTAIYEPERDITRAEAAILISRFGRIKWLFSWLYDFNRGYTHACRINTPPFVKEIRVTPKIVGMNENREVTLNIFPSDREGLEDILSVKADITAFNGLPDAQATKEGSGYILRFNAQPFYMGEKTITVTATDKLGWQGKAQTSILVVQ